MKINRLITALILLISVTFSAQNGYIYVHKKAISEGASLDFAFELKQGASSIKTFALNDKPDALNAFDLGNSHGAGEGQLWAVINNGSVNGSTHVIAGTLYTRPANNSQWAVTNVTDVFSVDGIGSNTAVYCNSSGAVAIYNAGTSDIIWTPASHGSVKIIDIASGGKDGIIVAVGSDGKLYNYTGTADSWTVFSDTTVSKVYRVDVNPTNQEIVFIRSDNQIVYRLASANLLNAAVELAVPLNTSSAGNSLRDVAISNNGTIYANYRNNIGSTNIFEFTSTWADNPTSRGLSGITAGAGIQSWGINKVNADIISHSIFSSTSSGLWLDDERVRTSVVNGNSIMIPVPAGTYTLTETANSAWSTSEIKVYDPTTNSSSSTATSSSTINVAAGEVVNVVYSNTVKNQIVTPATCGTNFIVTFGNGTAAYGVPLDGFSSYHYLPKGILGDGYYSIVKNSAEWYAGNNVSLLNHTPSDPNGYFGIFNASYATDDFFRQTVTGLSVGTVYEFAFWVADLSNANPIRPNITMGITDISTGTVINSITTGDISSIVWKQYKFNFTATSTTGEIFLKNNSIGGNGNDLAIDDITFAPAPPALLPPVAPSGVTVLCSNPSTQFQFTNPQAGGTWSTDTPTLISINATTGVVTTITGQSGTANISYTYSSSSGCSTTKTLSMSVGPCSCYVDPATGPGAASQHGITLLQRAAADNGNWPMIRKSAFTVLESNSKGFVITRMTSEPAQSGAANYITKITNPQEGMMIYDTYAKCLKINTDGTPSGWSCFSVPACP